MLEKLTKKQEDLMYATAKKWMDRMFNAKKRLKTNEKEAIKSINWLYEFCKLEKPKEIIFCDSPLGCQLLANVMDNVGANVRDNVGANVRDNIRDNVWFNVRDNVRVNVKDNVSDNVWDNVRVNVRDNVSGNVWDNVRANVRDNIWDNVWANIWANVRANVRANVGDKRLKYHSFAYYGSITDWGWVSFYDFFTQIGVLKNNDFNNYQKLIETGIYDMLQFKNICIVSKMPTDISYNGKLHNDKGKFAIKFADGYGFYALHGVRFNFEGEEAELYHKIIKKELSFKEIMGINNMEQRMVALKYIEPVKLLKGSNAKLLDRSDRGNELYLIKGVFSMDAYFLKYSCPSTGRVYVSGIDPEVGKDGNADKCMAWKHHFVLEEYNSLKVES